MQAVVPRVSPVALAMATRYSHRRDWQDDVLQQAVRQEWQLAHLLVDALREAILAEQWWSALTLTFEIQRHRNRARALTRAWREFR